MGKKKNFGDKKPGYQKEFIPSETLRPEMYQTHGFIADKSCAKLGRVLRQRGIDCKTMEDANDSNQACAAAVQENRIFVTSNLKLFNQKLSMPRCCVFYKSNSNSN